MPAAATKLRRAVSLRLFSFFFSSFITNGITGDSEIFARAICSVRTRSRNVSALIKGTAIAAGRSTKFTNTLVFFSESPLFFFLLLPFDSTWACCFLLAFSYRGRTSIIKILFYFRKSWRTLGRPGKSNRFDNFGKRSIGGVLSGALHFQASLTAVAWTF